MCGSKDNVNDINIPPAVTPVGEWDEAVMLTYEEFKVQRILGVALFLGNIIVTASGNTVPASNPGSRSSLARSAS